MKRFVEGEDRSQVTLLPECLDDYVAEDNPVRVVDVFVDELDLTSLGFEGAEPAATGRPAYHPAVLLKIYIYGYLNRIQSSRRLEREAQRNVELMWLTGRLTPDFKTIADFRKDNGKAIRKVCREFVVLCRQTRSVHRGDRGDRRQQVQGGQQPRQELHAAQAASADGAARGEHQRATWPSSTARTGSRPLCLPERVARLKEKVATVKAQMQRAEADRAAAAGRAGPAGLADRSGCALDGDQRPRHRHRRLQRADRGRYQAPPDRRPRGRPTSATTAPS